MDSPDRHSKNFEGERMSRFKRRFQQFLDVDQPLSTDERVVLRDYFAGISRTANVGGLMALCLVGFSIYKRRIIKNELFLKNVNELISGTTVLSRSELVHRAMNLKKRDGFVFKSALKIFLGFGAGYATTSIAATHFRYQRLVASSPPDSNAVKVADLVGYKCGIIPKLARYYSATAADPRNIISEPIDFFNRSRNHFWLR